MSTRLPILYSFRRCPYAMRARMALIVSEVQVELREVVLRDKPQTMLDISPKATVPVLQLQDGQVIDESFDVMLWALNQNDPEDWLKPESSSYENMMELITQVEIDFKPHLDRFKYSTRYEDIDPLEHREKARAFLEVLEGRLGENIYLCGTKPSLADYAIMPFVRQYANADKEWQEQEIHPKTLAWFRKLIEESPFMDITKKYKQWHAGDDVTLFPDSGV